MEPPYRLAIRGFLLLLGDVNNFLVEVFLLKLVGNLRNYVVHLRNGAANLRKRRFNLRNRVSNQRSGILFSKMASQFAN